MIGWMNVIDALDFGKYDYTLRPDAGRFECGSHNTPGLLALKASVEMLNALGIGMIAQRVEQRLMTEPDFLEELLAGEEELIDEYAGDELSVTVRAAV